MKSFFNTGRLTFLIAISVIVFACGSGSDEDIEIEIQILANEVQGVTNPIEVKKGNNVRLSLTSDKDMSVHLHGYDIKKDLESGVVTYLDFDAIATGLYVLTSHESDHEGHDKHDSHAHSANMNDHAALFESETLENGESFSYSIPTEMLDTTIFYHDHMSHDGKGSIKISNDGQSGIIKVIVAEGDVSFEPLDVIAVPGSTIEWTNQKSSKIRITSGEPPTSAKTDHHGGHAGHDDSDEHEEDEKVLISIEVRP